MKDEYIRRMEEFDEVGMGILASKNDSYNQGGVDVLDYFPFGYKSALTYVNENMMRLKSLYAAGASKEQIEEKWLDLLNWVKLGHMACRQLEK